jgi:hypothetical protein
MTELSADDMLLLRQIQVQNQRLRQEVGLRDDLGLPEVDGKMQMHIARLQEEVYKNFALREKLQKADKDCALLSVSLSKEERLALTHMAPTPERPSAFQGGAPLAEDDADVRRRTEAMMADIQEVTHHNIQLIKEYDEQIKSMEKALSTARRQHQQLQAQALAQTRTQPVVDEQKISEQIQFYAQELQALKENSQQLEEALNKERGRSKETELRTIQKLQAERDVLVEEIDKLRQSLQRGAEEEPAAMPPATGVLSAEADQLRTELKNFRDRGLEEQGELELQAEDLRQKTREYQEQLKKVEEEKLKVQTELQELRMNRDGARAIERDSMELQRTKDDLANASGRCRSMIRVYDEKITELKKETDDIRRRVQDVSRGPGGGSFSA